MDALKWISTEAKKIRKKHPKMLWKDAIKKASVLYKSKNKIGSVKTKKVSGIKNKYMPTKKTARKKIGAASETSILSQIKKTQNDIAKLEAMQKTQLGKKHKGAIVGTIRKKHKKLNSLIKRY